MKTGTAGMKGSCTVEAAMIMPVVIAAIVIVIYSAFYLHDRTVLNGIAYKAALRGSQAGESDKDLMAAGARNMAVGFMEHRLLAARNVKVTARVEEGAVKVVCDGEFHIPTGMITGILSEKEMPRIRAEKRVEIREPTAFIRDCRKIMKLADE